MRKELHDVVYSHVSHQYMKQNLNFVSFFLEYFQLHESLSTSNVLKRNDIFQFEKLDQKSTQKRSWFLWERDTRFTKAIINHTETFKKFSEKHYWLVLWEWDTSLCLGCSPLGSVPWFFSTSHISTSIKGTDLIWMLLTTVSWIMKNKLVFDAHLNKKQRTCCKLKNNMFLVRIRNKMKNV